MFNLSICTGVLGLFIALPLLWSRRDRPANLWLGLFIFSLSWLSLQVLYFRYPSKLFGVFDPPVAAIGAFYYLYVRNLAGLGNDRRQAWHFVPLVLWSGALLSARILVPPKTIWAWFIGPGAPIFGALLILFQALAIGYALAVLYRLRQYRQRVRENYSSVKERDLMWLSTLSKIIIAMLIVWIPATLFGGELGNAALVLGRLVTLFFMGWYGMQQYAVLLPEVTPGVAKVAELAAPSSEPIAIGLPVKEPTPNEIVEEKYARSGMSAAAQELIGARLIQRMAQHRDYLGSDIKLVDVAERLGTSPQLLSQYLNQVLGLSFFDYINGLRVAEVKKLMADESHADSPLLHIAFAAGFNSKSTFNTSFKRITGVAPSVWRNQQIRLTLPNG